MGENSAEKLTNLEGKCWVLARASLTAGRERTDARILRDELYDPNGVTFSNTR